jgi:hypothetical protein
VVVLVYPFCACQLEKSTCTEETALTRWKGKTTNIVYCVGLRGADSTLARRYIVFKFTHADRFICEVFLANLASQIIIVGSSTYKRRIDEVHFHAFVKVYFSNTIFKVVQAVISIVESFAKE